MIAKASSCIGGTALIGYVVNPKKGYELERNNLSGVKASELYESMRVIQNQNLRCKNNTISIVLSPEVEDGKRLSDAQWRDLSKRFLNGLGIDADDSQYLCFIHTEKEHKHVHIIINRINYDGTPVKDNYIGKRAQRVAHELALEMGLKSARDIKQQREQSEKQRAKQFRMDFKQAHEEVSNLQPTSIEAYCLLMKPRGFEVKPTINKQGNVQGYRVKNIRTGEDLKLSQIDRKIKLDDKFFEELKQSKEQQMQSDIALKPPTIHKPKRRIKL
ncbi:MAG: relaxase/mobilization nuclease domain-containing protein [Bacteroidales bacterium]